VNKLVINQSSPAGISSHVFDLVSKILRIADAMLVETRLPYLSRELLPDGEREAALNALHAPFDRFLRSRRQQNMQMFWHNSKGMQQESPLVSVSEYCAHEEFRVCGAVKERSPLKRHGGDGVGTDSAPRI
jgi:hypothetical protein